MMACSFSSDTITLVRNEDLNMLMKRSLASTSSFFCSSPVVLVVPDIPYLKQIQLCYNDVNIFCIYMYSHCREQTFLTSLISLLIIEYSKKQEIYNTDFKRSTCSASKTTSRSDFVCALH